MRLYKGFGGLIVLCIISPQTDLFACYNTNHTTYIRNNMCPKCGGKSGLWDNFFRLEENYAENMRKIVGALWELPAK